MGSACSNEFCNISPFNNRETIAHRQLPNDPQPGEPCNVAILGGVCSGKSTLMKNMLLTYDDLDFNGEHNVQRILQHEIPIATQEIITLFQKLNRKYPKRYNLSKESPQTQDAYNYLLKLINNYQRQYDNNNVRPFLFDEKALEKAQILWTQATVIHEIHSIYNGYYINRNLKDVMSRLNDILLLEQGTVYEPYYKDVLKIYQPTQQLNTKKFEVVLQNDQDLAINVTDVGGNMIDAWPSITKNVDCIVFCVSLLSYYRRSFRDSNQNDLSYSLKVFDAIMNGRTKNVIFDSKKDDSNNNNNNNSINNSNTNNYLDESSLVASSRNNEIASYLKQVANNLRKTKLVVVILFDTDGLKQMLEIKKLSDIPQFKDYNKPNSYQSVNNYIKQKFESLIPKDKTVVFESISGISGSKMRNLCMGIIHNVIELKFQD